MIKVIAEVDRYQSRKPVGDTGPYSDRGETDGKLRELRAVYCEGDGDWWDSRFDCSAEPGDVVHAVVAQYSTGNSFGRDGCQIKVMNVFKHEDRHLATGLMAALQDENAGFGVEYHGVPYRLPWKGYFESLEKLWVEVLVVQHGQ